MRKKILFPETNEEEFHLKKPTLDRLMQGTIISQTVSAFTEFTAFYWVFYARQVGQPNAHFNSMVAAVLLTAFIEIGQRATFLPTARQLVGLKPMTGLNAFWTVSLICISSLLLIVSTYGSVVTVGKAVEITNSSSSVSIDSIEQRKNREIALVRKAYSQDSLDAQNIGSAISLAEAQKNAGDLRKISAKIKYYEDLEKKPGSAKYTTRKALLNRELESEKAKQAQNSGSEKIAQTNTISLLSAKKTDEITAINEKYIALFSGAKKVNDQSAKKGENENFRFTFFGIMVVLIAQLYLAFACAMKATFEEITGSKIVYDLKGEKFTTTATSELATAISLYFSGLARKMAIVIESRATTPPEITEPVISEDVKYYDNQPAKFEQVEKEVTKPAPLPPSNKKQSKKKKSKTQGITLDSTIEEIKKEITRIKGNIRANKSNGNIERMREYEDRLLEVQEILKAKK